MVWRESSEGGKGCGDEEYFRKGPYSQLFSSVGAKPASVDYSVSMVSGVLGLPRS